MIASRLRIFFTIKNVVTPIKTADRTDTTTAIIMVVFLLEVVGIVVVCGPYCEPSVLMMFTVTLVETIAPNDPRLMLDGEADCTLLARAVS